MRAGDTLIAIAKVFNCQLAELIIKTDLLTQTGLLAPQSTLFVPLVRRQSQASDSFRSISSQPVYASGFDAATLATFNAGLGILQNGAKVEFSKKGSGIGSPYIVQPRDCLGDIANYFGVSLLELISDNSENGVLARTDLIAPATILFTPPFICQAQAADQLQTIANRYATIVDVIAEQSFNGEVSDLFSTTNAEGQPAPYLDVPHLAQFRAGELIAECQRSFALQHLSSMASRYYLHGLRLPTQHIQPLQKGMWVKSFGDKLTLPEYAGLYALTGQQFPLPSAFEGKDFTITFDNSAGPEWLQFDDRDNKTVNRLQIEIAPGSDEAKRINTLTNYARMNRLDIHVDRLGVGRIAESELTSYPFTSSLIWQSTSSVTLPYASPNNEVPSLRLWRIPEAMRGLSEAPMAQTGSATLSRAVNPQFKLQIARYDEATGSTQKSDVANYGWATAIDFTIKKIIKAPASPATASTYEVVGAGGSDILLLERMVAQIGKNEAYFSQIVMGYAHEQTSNASSGVQTDPSAGVTLGIAQVNLSTDTRPTGVFATRMAASRDFSSNLLNTPSQFITLLWEASITRSGGFYLYYYSASDGRGLPDKIFNDKNEATFDSHRIVFKTSVVKRAKYISQLYERRGYRRKDGHR